MYRTDELPTLEDFRSDDLDDLDFTGGDAISTTLPVNAQTCYELFCQVERTPEWVSRVRSVQTLGFDELGRPTRAAFLASIGRGSAGYTLEYRYCDSVRLVSWSTPEGMMTRVAGRALFVPLTERATMMHYELDLEWPPALGFGRSMFEGHPASETLNDFRDFVIRSFM